MTIITDPNEIAKWKEAGRVTAEVREYSKSLIREGVKIIEIAKAVEAKVEELGAELAFPVNLSLNECAAHDSADIDDERMLKADDVLKVDLGVSVDGYIGDSAYTVNLSGKYDDLVKASREALENAIKRVRAGATVSEVGRDIQETIEGYGFRPVFNLSGHGLGRFEIHTSPSMPNYDTGSELKLAEGMIIAIEPFATTGAGKIHESGKALIFSQTANKPARSQFARKILEIVKPLGGLPFSVRRLNKNGLSMGQIAFGMRELLNNGIVRDYPPLVEIEKGLVSQAEHSLIVTKDGCEILTEL